MVPSYIYTANLGSLLTAGDVLSQAYADDLHVHGTWTCMAVQVDAAVGSMSQAMDALLVWMSSNSIRLNQGKTRPVWLGTPQQLSKIDLASLAL